VRTGLGREVADSLPGQDGVCRTESGRESEHPERAALQRALMVLEEDERFHTRLRSTR
jgi:hypothetical protein